MRRTHAARARASSGSSCTSRDNLPPPPRAGTRRGPSSAPRAYRRRHAAVYGGRRAGGSVLATWQRVGKRASARRGSIACAVLQSHRRLSLEACLRVCIIVPGSCGAEPEARGGTLAERDARKPARRRGRRGSPKNAPSPAPWTRSSAAAPPTATTTSAALNSARPAACGARAKPRLDVRRARPPFWTRRAPFAPRAPRIAPCFSRPWASRPRCAACAAFGPAIARAEASAAAARSTTRPRLATRSCWRRC